MKMVGFLCKTFAFQPIRMSYCLWKSFLNFWHIRGDQSRRKKPPFQVTILEKWRESLNIRQSVQLEMSCNAGKVGLWACQNSFIRFLENFKTIWCFDLLDLAIFTVLKFTWLGEINLKLLSFPSHQFCFSSIQSCYYISIRNSTAVLFLVLNVELMCKISWQI